MAIDARYQGSRTPGARPNPMTQGPALTPEELAEFIDSLKEDESLTVTADSGSYDPEYND